MAGETHRDSGRERGMSAAAIARMDAAIARRVDKQIQRALEKAEAKIAAAIKAEATRLTAMVSSALQNASRRLDAIANASLAHLDAMEKSGGNPEDIAAMRARIESLEGATSAVGSVAPYLGLLNPAARIAVVAGAAALGFTEGSTRSRERKRAADAASAEDDRGLDADRIAQAARDSTDRLVAARKRARGKPR